MSNKYKSVVLVILSTIIVLGLSIWAWTKEYTEYSDSERRVLNSMPELSMESILNGKFTSSFETYTQDQFPLRDTFRAIKTYAVLYGFNSLENNNLYIQDGYISKLDYPFKPAVVDHAIERFQNIYNKFLDGKDVNVYLSIIPDKNYFLAEDRGMLSIDYPTFIEYVKSGTNYAEYIDITSLLSIEDYYKTDTHWKQENIKDVADHILDSMGVSTDTVYQINTLDKPFYGVYSGQIAIPVDPDELKYVTSEEFEGVTVTSYDTGSPVEKYIYDMNEAYGKDPYEMFMSGSDALIVVDNPNAKTDKELVIFRDSFGSSISPYFISSYKKITLIDIRYIQSDMLGFFIKFNNQDVLFMYSTMMLNSSLGFK